MNKILYVSSSIIPSKNANSIQVMKMCQAFVQTGNEVFLVATKGDHADQIFEHYNVTTHFNLLLSSSLPVISTIARIYKAFATLSKVDLVYTRWGLAAFLLGLLSGKKVIYEHHAPAYTPFHNVIEWACTRIPNVIRHIFITKALEEHFKAQYPAIVNRDCIVLTDGADTYHDYKMIKNKLLECGYIGSFMTGKGIEIVIAVANRMPDILFHVVGGSNEDIEKLKRGNPSNNIIWHGYLPQREAMNILETIDIALLPNQPVVLVGQRQKDIGKWTSPLKLFEYMAQGKAIVASDIPVLREVLTNRVNALLVKPSGIDEWVDSIEELIVNHNLRQAIGHRAKEELETRYSWITRAKRSLEGLKL